MAESGHYVLTRGSGIGYPIVEVMTKDRLPLYGLFLEAKASKTILINMHGTASNFYENYFMVRLTEACLKEGISVLSANNRGAAVMQVYPHAGAALEHFEDCIIDIDSWIEFALERGYERILLQGHSLGAEKAVYYADKGSHKERIKGLILLGPADSYAYTVRLFGEAKMQKLLEEASELTRQGKNEQFLTSTWLCHADVLPKGAESFMNFFSKNSELSKALPFGRKELPLYRKIRVPVFVAIGDKHEYTIIPAREALELMEKENKRTECHQIKNCDHDFDGKEAELAESITDFIRRKVRGP